jgi:4-carboxymuconolactone decarboxylase
MLTHQKENPMRSLVRDSVVLMMVFAGTGCRSIPPTRSTEEATMREETERHQRGLVTIRQVGGANYDAPLTALADIAPDLARFTVDFAYGDVLSRPGLDLKTRQLCTVAALAAMGSAHPQLRYHIDGALNLGWSPAEILEALMLSTVYAGFPAALNGVTAAREVFQQRNIMPISAAGADRLATSGDRYARGLKAVERVSAGSGRAVIKSLEDIAPDLARFIVEFSYGDIISRQVLDDRTKELATVALLTALGTAQPQLRVHISAARNVGASREQIVESIQQMAVYAGFPAALNGISAAREVFAKR